MNGFEVNGSQLVALKKSNIVNRLGCLFEARKRTYFYDTGTGKAVMLDQKVKDIFENLFSPNSNAQEFCLKWKQLTVENQNEICSFLNKENLLQCPPLKKFSSSITDFSTKKIEIEQIILELTEKCNLRCKYCIYNDYNKGNRDFSSSDMTFDIAKKSIDYGFAHHAKHFAITFYGGEPLVNFSLMKQCINYSLKNAPECELTFSFTTNLTLMTPEIANFLVQIPGMNIVLSLDGPQEIHNTARVYANNKPTFEDAMRGLTHLTDAIKRHSSSTNLTVNSVFMPPYSVEKLEYINNFFENLDILPKTCTVKITYPSPGTIPERYLTELQTNSPSISETPNPLVEWMYKKAEEINFSECTKNLYYQQLQDVLARIHQRFLVNKPYETFARNGCCTPGQRRLYITTSGMFKICERIGDSPNIGDVNHGLDIDSIKKYYFDDYDAKSIPECANCWAIRLCNICYASCFSMGGINMEKKIFLCNTVRELFKEWLGLYYTILETHPERLDYMRELTYL